MTPDGMEPTVDWTVPALGASGPHPDHAGELMLFGQFVGYWDLDVTLIRPDGSCEEHRAEWHFALGYSRDVRSRTCS